MFTLEISKKSDKATKKLFFDSKKVVCEQKSTVNFTVREVPFFNA
jgi:hypothetical protein